MIDFKSFVRRAMLGGKYNWVIISELANQRAKNIIQLSGICCAPR